MNKDNLFKISGYISLAVVVVILYLYFSHKPAEKPVLTKDEAEIEKLLPSDDNKNQAPTTATPLTSTETPPTDPNAPADAGVNNMASQQALIESYSEKINKNNNDADSYYRRAVIYQDMQQYSQAIGDYTEVLRILPKSANAFFNRGVVQTDRKDFVKAIDDLNRAIDLSPNDPVFYNARGVAYFAQNNLEKAAADYKKAIEIDPKFGQAYFNLGTVYEKQNNFPDAIAQYDKSIETYDQDEDSTNAEAELNRLLEVYYRRAFIKFQTKNYDAALADINFFIEKNQKSVKAYRLRSAIYGKLGNTAAALEDENTAQNLGFEDLLR